MNLWRPYTQMQTALPPIKIVAAQGAYLETHSGQKIYDGISSWWLITHGHGESKIVDAIQKQAARLEQVVFANFTHEPAEQLSEKLGQLLPRQLQQMFLSDNGSTAVEVAMKMAYQFCLQQNKKQKTKFISFTQSYHGDTCGAMSVNGDSAFTAAYSGLRFEVLRVGQGVTTDDSTEQWLAPLRRVLQHRSQEVCAVLMEPLLQGAGGMIVWPLPVVQEICRLAREHDVLVIFDEVMTGFGRTGTLFAFEQVDFIPDFLCLSKGITGGFLPLGVTVTSDEIYAGFLDSQPDKMLFHGHSFTGNAISCAAAAANLDICAQFDFKFKLSQLSAAQQRGLQKFQRKVASSNLRVCGTIGAIDLEVASEYGSHLSAQIHRLALQKNLFIRPLGRTLYVMPPYCSTNVEVEAAWNLLGDIVTSLPL